MRSVYWTTRARSSRRSALRPNTSSTVGAMSIRRGVSVLILRFDQNTPGTRRGSTQWSPDQLLVLSVNTFFDTAPVAQSHEWRKPLW